MMKILFLARATLFSVYGGDTMQIISTAKYLQRLGVHVDIRLANENIDYKEYDLLHIFNVTRPSDVLSHIKRCGLPFVLSMIYVDYSEFQEKHARGVPSLLSKIFSADRLEYAKALGRYVKNGEKINSLQYLYQGHRKSVRQLAQHAAYLLPNSETEYKRFSDHYDIDRPYKVIYNGVDPEVFVAEDGIILPKRDTLNVICVSRIEGRKNHLNLIKALNNTPFHLKIIGKPAPNHIKYYEACIKAAASNISFEGFMSQHKLIDYYMAAKVHILPSWNETCGLTSLEAAFYNCNLVITDKGDTVEYFGNNAWYCDPGSPASILKAVEKASEASVSNTLRRRIIDTYNWQHAAEQTLSVYEAVLSKRLVTNKVNEKIGMKVSAETV